VLKNLFLTVLLILVALAIFAVVGTPKLATSSSAAVTTPTPAASSTAPAPSASSAARPTASAPAAAPASEPHRIAPGGKAIVGREAQMILEYGTWRVPAGTEVLILEITGQNAKVRANGQEGVVLLSALQP
jgi:cytoskeletal protein RodZ